MLVAPPRPDAAPPHPAAAGRRPYLAPLDGLRFVAAMHIVLLHTFRADWLPGWAERLLVWGTSTTSFFFLLSGFVLAHVYARPDGRMALPARAFWGRRFARLVPLGVLGHLSVVPLLWTLYGPVERWVRAAAAATGTQAWVPWLADSFDTPAWVLSFLAAAYLVFPAALERIAGWDPPRLRRALVALWLLGLVAPAALALAGGRGTTWEVFVHTFPLLRLPEFLAGVVLARLFAQTRAAPPRWMAGAAGAALAAGLVLAPAALFPLARNGLFLPLHAALLWGLAVSRGPAGRLLGSAPLRALGNASLALFLLHVPVYTWSMHLFHGTVAERGIVFHAAFYAGYLAAALAVALLAERWVARPAAERLRARGGARPEG